jgi:PAS domain S-box-containing protein
MSRRTSLAAVSVAGLAGAFLLTWLTDAPGEPGGALIFAPFVALLAFEFGAIAGLGSALVAVVVYAGAVELAGEDVPPDRFLGRLLPMLVLGAGVGWLNARLRAHEQMYRRIVETSAEVICMIDPQSVIVYVNGRSRDMLGYEPEELLGQHVSRVLEPEAVARVAQRLEERRQGTAGPWAYDMRLRHKDGREVVGFVNSTPMYDANGGFVGSLAMISDLTERRRIEHDLREREQALEDAQAIAHLGSWTWDIAENRVTWSDELYRIYGLDAAEFEASYEAFVERVHPDDRQLVNEAVQGGYATGKPFRFEHRIVRPDGEIRYLEGRGAVFRDGGARPTRMAGTGHDITDRRLAEDALVAARVARKQATELNDNVVQGLVLAKYALDRDDAATAAALVASTLDEARRMIDDLLGDAEVEPGQLRRQAAAGLGDAGA